MQNPLEKAIGSFRRPPPEAVAEYEDNEREIIESVNRRMLAREDFYSLIGESPLETVLENHENHFGTIAEVLSSGRFDLLVANVPWVYRSYSARGVAPDYFAALFSTFRDVLSEVLSEEASREIVPFYDKLFESHAAMVEYSLGPDSREYEGRRETELDGDARDFRDALLTGDHRACLHLAANGVSSGDDLEAFYIGIIQPAMYSIGSFWERGEISVAEEHLASAVVARVMASLYSQILGSRRSFGKAIVSAAPNEFHEIGARMVADLLERDGWSVEYLGSDMEGVSLLERVDRIQPFFLALSVAMPFNLKRAQEIIGGARKNPQLERLRIMVGGQVFEKAPGFWRAMGADGYAENAAEAARLAAAWWKDADRRRSRV